MSDLWLSGLHSQNLAAHFAFYGALRILEEDRREWESRGFWQLKDDKWTAALRLPAEADEDKVCGVLTAGLMRRGHLYREALDALGARVKARKKDEGESAPTDKRDSGDKKKKALNWTNATPAEFGEAVRDLWRADPAANELDKRTSAELLCALSAGNVKGGTGKNADAFEFSPLLLVEGSNRANIKDGFGGWKAEKDIPSKIHDALFGGEWARVNESIKWYWDSYEWADQARIGADSGTDKKRSPRIEWAGTALAVVGFCGLGAFAAPTGGRRLRTDAPGFSKAAGVRAVYLPLWDSAAAFAAVRELLGMLPSAMERIRLTRNEKEYRRLCYRLKAAGVARVVKVEFFTGAKGRQCARLGEMFLDV